MRAEQRSGRHPGTCHAAPDRLLHKETRSSLIARRKEGIAISKRFEFACSPFFAHLYSLIEDRFDIRSLSYGYHRSDVSDLAWERAHEWQWSSLALVAVAADRLPSSSVRTRRIELRQTSCSVVLLPSFGLFKTSFGCYLFSFDNDSIDEKSSWMRACMQIFGSRFPVTSQFPFLDKVGKRRGFTN